jgi:hypothetical protein
MYYEMWRAAVALSNAAIQHGDDLALETSQRLERVIVTAEAEHAADQATIRFLTAKLHRVENQSRREVAA